MKTKLFHILFAAALTAACNLVNATTQVPTVLSIRASIDGRSWLMIRGKELYWQHLNFDAPGRWEHNATRLPTYVNQTTWEPTWPDVPDPTNDTCNCASSVFTGIPSLAGNNQRVWMDIVQARGRVFIIQHPDAANDYTLVVEMDDNSWEGADWYEVHLNYMVGPVAPQSGTPTPVRIPPPAGKESGIVTASISGKILYESVDPFLRVYAREVHTGQVTWINPGEGSPTYTIPDLPPGTYVVVGWFHPMGASGAYTSLDLVVAETGAQQKACREAIAEIELAPGENFTGADIGCWGGDFFDLTE